MDIKVSLIVPVYNVEQYISSSIQRILEQDFNDWELLLVDDGSFDNSGVICDSFAEDDDRIKVYHNKHHGVSYARQFGLEKASGEYLLYVDADDVMSPNMVKELYCEAKRTESDIVICDYEELTHEGRKTVKQKLNGHTGRVLLNEIYEGKIYGALWNKLIRRERINEDVYFPTELTMREDLIFISRLVPYINKISYLPKVLYGYERRNINALTNKYLDESTKYYHQEVIFNLMLLETNYLSDNNVMNVSNYLQTLAYITLKADLFSKNEWKELFIPNKKIITKGVNGYKGLIVYMAIHGMFPLARFIRTLIAR